MKKIIEKHFEAYLNCDLNGKMELNRNRVYRYVNDNVKLYFMSFLYPNSISDDIWAYRNKELLKGVPHKRVYDDLAITFHVLVDSDKEGGTDLDAL